MPEPPAATLTPAERLKQHVRLILGWPAYSSLTPAQKRETLRRVALDLANEEYRASQHTRVDMRGVD